MDIHNNILINSSNRLKEEVIESKLEGKNIKSGKSSNSNLVLPQNSNIKINIENISTNQEKNNVKTLKNNFLTQDKDDKRKDCISDSVSINSDILIKSSKTKDNNNIYNNYSKYYNSYTSEGNQCNENNDESARKVSKINKLKKRIKYRVKEINKKGEESTDILNLKLVKNKTKTNLVVKNGLSKTIGDDNITSINFKKINELEEHNNNSPNKHISYIKINSNNNQSINQRNNKCLFCDRISENEEYNSFFTCGHFFCKKCGKIFYEEIIETMIKKRKFNFMLCPVMDCPKVISLSLLKMFIEANFYNELVNNIDKSKHKENNKKNNNNNIINNKKEKNDINIMHTELFEKKENKNNKKRYYNEYDRYLQTNIIDFNTYKKYIYFIQKNFIRCTFCQEYSLYGKIDGNFDICLKCLKKYCKYCHKEFYNSHLDLREINHCKVLYRTYKDFIQQKFYFKFLFNLLYVIGGYLFILTIFMLEIKRTIRHEITFLNIIKIVLYFILFLIFLPICIIIIPYFPMLISI